MFVWLHVGDGLMDNWKPGLLVELDEGESGRCWGPPPTMLEHALQILDAPFHRKGAGYTPSTPWC